MNQPQTVTKWALIRKRVLTVVLWLLSAFLVLVFVNAGYPKFSDSSRWTEAFAGWGYPVWFRIFVGAVEVLGSVLLLVPRTAIYAAAALSVIMLGGMGTHIFHGDPAAIYHEAIPLALLTAVAYLRRREVKTQDSLALSTR